jgi:hypothetical protein
MNFLPLLGKRLKDHDIVELLKDFDAEVLYDFDRTHNHKPDVYWAKCKKNGLLLRFDETQILDRVILHLVNHDEYEPIAVWNIRDIRIFTSAAEVEAHCVETGTPCLKSAVDAKGNAWARIDGGPAQILYRFIDGRTSIITLTLQRPGGED